MDLTVRQVSHDFLGSSNVNDCPDGQFLSMDNGLMQCQGLEEFLVILRDKDMISF